MSKFFMVVILALFCAGCTGTSIKSRGTYPAGDGVLTDATGNPIAIEELVQ